MRIKLKNMKEIFIRKLFLSLMAIFLLPSFFSEKLEAKIELLDKVIAVVDSGIIMESELKKRVEDIIWRLRNEGTELPPKKILEEQILERLIIEEIQLQIGERAGVKISDTELNRSLSMIASQNSMDLEQFKESLEANRESYRDLRESVRKEMIIQRVPVSYTHLTLPTKA